MRTLKSEIRNPKSEGRAPGRRVALALHHVCRSFFALLCLVTWLPPLHAADNADVVIVKPVDDLGFPKPVPVNITGFSGEVDAVLKNDLRFMGIIQASVDEAKYLVTGSVTERVEGFLKEKTSQRTLLSKAYTGASLRAQAHALADDIAAVIFPGVPGIARTKVSFRVETGAGRGGSEIYIADYDGANPQPVTADNSTAVAPSWAGREMLFYCSYLGGNPAIYAHHLPSGSRPAIARFGGSSFAPAVSPDYQRLAMVLSKDGNPELYVSDLNGGNLQRLTQTREAEADPCWSPDGKRICYVSRDSGTARLYVIPATGGKARALSLDASSPTAPDWSPDGKWIAFTTPTRGGFQVCIVRAEGGISIPLVDGEDPSWAPNSRTLIIARGHDHAKRLSLLDAPTKHVKDVARILQSNSQPSWGKSL